MPDDTNKQADELAALRAEVEALKAAQLKPQPSVEERERETREWIDKMHQMREGRMSHAMHPSVVRDLNVIPDDVCKDIVGKGGIRGPSQPGGKS
jgi:hypothetical protein